MQASTGLLTFHALIEVEVGFNTVVADSTVLVVVGLDLLTPVTCSYLWCDVCCACVLCQAAMLC